MYLRRIQFRTIVLAAVGAVAAGGANAGTIIENLSGSNITGGIGFSLGQSLTTQSGGSWNALSFNLISAANTPFALGTLYLLEQDYAGKPANLSPSTAGFIASTSTADGSFWTFAPDVELKASTKYYFMMVTAFNGPQVRFSLFDSLAGGNLYNWGGGPGYYSDRDLDLQFQLTGSVSNNSAPEPATILLSLFGMGGIVAFGRRA